MKNEEHTLQQIPAAKIKIKHLKSIRTIFSDQNTLCIQSNEAYYICIDKNCNKKNPFICFSKDCPCVQIHEDCDQKRINSVLKKAQTKATQHAEIQEQINEIFDQIHDQLSAVHDKIIAQIHEGHLRDSFQQQLNEVTKQNGSTQIQSMTGGQVHKIFFSDETNSRQNHPKVLESLKEKAKQFEEKTIKKFSLEIRSLVLKDPLTQTIRFSKKFFGNGLQHNEQLSIKCLWPQSYRKLWTASFEPSVNQLLKKSGNLSWTIFLKQTTGTFCFGISPKSVAKTGQLHFQNNNLASLVVCDKQGYGSQMLKCQKYDTIAVTLLHSIKLIVFESLLNKKKVILKIPETVFNQVQEWYITVGLSETNDEMEVSSEIQSFKADKINVDELLKNEPEVPDPIQNRYSDATLSSNSVTSSGYVTPEQSQEDHQDNWNND